MRFTSYCVGEGVRSVSEKVFWATHTPAGMVTDASVSARAKGLRPGLTTRAAKAMIPEVECVLETGELPDAMGNVLQIVSEGTPWIERIGKDNFYFQVPGNRPPMREIRSILARTDQLLTTEQRIQVGMAETPHLARTLVEWNRLERVPEALYWRVGRQIWLVSPGVAATVHGKPQHESLTWLGQLPVLAFWIVPVAVRERLVSLGVYRLNELKTIPVTYLKRQFGLESLNWLEWLKQLPKGSLQINYPLQQSIVQWASDIGDEASVSALTEIVEGLAVRMERVLLQRSMGTLRLTLEWETERGADRFERAVKYPIADTDALLATVEAGLQEIEVNRFGRSERGTGRTFNGRVLERVRLIAQDLQALAAVQQRLPEWVMQSTRPGAKPQANSSQQLARFGQLRRGAVFPERRASRGDAGEDANLPRLVRHVNRKFPGALQLGLRPTFRELRLQAVRSAGGTEFSLRLGSVNS